MAEDFGDYILKVRQWQEQDHGNQKLLSEIIELQKKLGIVASEGYKARPEDEQVFCKDGFRCVYCGFDGRTFEGWAFLVVDHFKPRSRGGSDDLGNLMTACVICNSMKGDNDWPTLDEARRNLQQWWGQMRGFWKSKVQPLVPRN